MKTWSVGLLSALMPIALAAFCNAADPAVQGSQSQQTSSISLVVNLDLAFPTPNTVSFFVASGTQLTSENDVYTGGYGIQGGFFGTSRVNSVPSLSAPCLYASDSATNDIASVSLASQQVISNISGSQTKWRRQQA